MPIFRLEGDDISNAKLIIAPPTDIQFEKHLESWLENSPIALIQDEFILWIGKRPSAKDEEGTIFPDLLGVDAEGNLVIVEFKRRRTPRKVVAQLLEYAAWANELLGQQIHEIAEAYFKTREEFKGKNFQDTFKEMFAIPETDELPSLNRNLRLFIVAEEITPRIGHVCRFLRTSYSIDVNCIAVSMFQTEAGEKIVSMETKVGGETSPGPPSPRPSPDKPRRQVVLKAVQELTEGNTNVEFAPIDVKKRISEKFPDFKLAPVNYNIRVDTVNQSQYDVIPVDERNYWCVEQGVYRLYDPENDKIESNGDTNQYKLASEESAHDH